MIQSGKFDSFSMDIKKLGNSILIFTINRLIEIIGIFVCCIGILFFISLISYSPTDPNFIFQNDPTFNQVMLWDIDSNWVYVNSFVECEHYVLGGWSNLPPVTFAEGLDLLTLSKLLVGLLIINTCIKIFGKFKGKIV